MKILKLAIFSLIALFSVGSVQAQTADEVIAKYINAIGGKEKLNAITSLRMENTMQVMGNDAPSTTTVLNGKGYRSESDFNGQKMVQVITEKGGWAINPMMGSADPQPMPDEQYKAGQEQIYVVPLLDYAARGSKAELLGQEKVGDVNAYKVKVTNKNNVATTYFFDPSTNYLIQAVRTGNAMGQQMDITISYSEFKKTDYGIVLPQATNVDLGGQFSVSSKVNKVEVNKPVDASIFEMKK
ncbi:MAG: outer membrane lipoprotein-sorting protein [Flavisolibacter sp.]|nr:outer membrane lipoprotein-sorting protein [Flavisolibacter sp.]